MDVADILERAADLIEPEGAWIQNRFEDGCGGYCVSGAVVEAGVAYRSAGESAAMLRALGFETWGEAFAWNDAPERTQSEVVAKLREAAAIARATPPKGSRHDG